MVFVGFASGAAALQTESATLPRRHLHMESTAGLMHKNTKLGAGVALPTQSAQAEQAAHTLQAVD